MLEHVPEPASIVQAIGQALKPGGVAVLSTLNRTAKGFALGIVAAEYVLRWVEPGTHHYRKFIRPSELVQFCRDAGLDLTDMTGLRFNPLHQAFELTPRDVDVNYFICVRKPHAD